MTESPPLPAKIWNRVPPEAQALILLLLNKVAIFEKRVDELERQNAELRERLHRSSRNSSKPPSSDHPHVKRSPPKRSSGKKRGGQPGHPKHERELVSEEQVRSVTDVLPSECRKCAAPLKGKDPEPLRHQVAEIPPFMPVVDEYRLHRLICPECGISTCGELHANIPQGHFGPRLMALVATLSGVYRLGKRPLQQLLLDLCGLRISTGMVCKLQAQMSKVLSRLMEQILEAIAGPAVHMDETGWRENHRRAWLWVVVTPLVTAFRIAATRESKVVSELLGTRVNYVVNCDRAKAYRHLRWIQWCWAHLERDFQVMIDRGGKARRVGSGLLSHAGKRLTGPLLTSAVGWRLSRIPQGEPHHATQIGSGTSHRMGRVDSSDSRRRPCPSPGFAGAKEFRRPPSTNGRGNCAEPRFPCHRSSFVPCTSWEPRLEAGRVRRRGTIVRLANGVQIRLGSDWPVVEFVLKRLFDTPVIDSDSRETRSC